jgi:hypothetical protein
MLFLKLLVYDHIYIMHASEQGELTASYKMNRVRINRLKFRTSGELLIMLEESMEYTSN